MCGHEEHDYVLDEVAARLDEGFTGQITLHVLDGDVGKVELRSFSRPQKQTASQTIQEDRS